MRGEQEKVDIARMVEEAVKDGAFPSAALLVSKGEKIIFQDCFGDCDEKTIFDVASLTKPIVTTTLFMIAVQKGVISLEAPLSNFFPKASEKITITHLLSHTSGLPAWKPYYEKIPKEEVGTPKGRWKIIDFILDEKLDYETGSKRLYSDLGFILLGAVLEDLFGESLAAAANDLIFSSLKVERSFFRSVGGSDHSDFQFAPTEDCPWRGKIISGEVHDQNCYAMGGVAGHAGLFSDAKDIYKFVAALLSCRKGEGRFFDRKILELFIGGKPLLGWDRPEAKNSQAGRHFSKETIGHLGYTGCSLWIDLARETSVVLLSNRTYPTSKNEKIKKWRPLIHDKIMEEVVG